MQMAAGILFKSLNQLIERSLGVPVSLFFRYRDLLHIGCLSFA